MWFHTSLAIKLFNPIWSPFIYLVTNYYEKLVLKSYRIHVYNVVIGDTHLHVIAPLPETPSPKVQKRPPPMMYVAAVAMNFYGRIQNLRSVVQLVDFSLPRIRQSNCSHSNTIACKFALLSAKQGTSDIRSIRSYCHQYLSFMNHLR